LARGDQRRFSSCERSRFGRAPNHRTPARPRLTTIITVTDQAHNAIISNGSTSAPQQFFPGVIDEVAYYPIPLSPGQIARHYVAGVH
jgi:hypothetical protein